jgi:ribosomal protein S18 acetylase RimI-like enzyme
MNTYTHRKIRKEDMMTIKPLWLQLNDMHREDSVYFKDYYGDFTFEKRISKFEACDEKSIMIEVVEIDGPVPVGYCIATIGLDGSGEIDSIFIDTGHRGNGIGDTLMRNSIAWLRAHGCARIRVAVAHGHESVFPFYRKFGFFPRMTYLEMK